MLHPQLFARLLLWIPSLFFLVLDYRMSEKYGRFNDIGRKGQFYVGSPGLRTIWYGRVCCCCEKQILRNRDNTFYLVSAIRPVIDVNTAVSSRSPNAGKRNDAAYMDIYELAQRVKSQTG